MKRTLFLLALAALLLAQQNTPRLTSDLVKDLALRNIQGTFSSGRIADIAVDPKNRSTSGRSGSIRGTPTWCGWRRRDRCFLPAAIAACTRRPTAALRGRHR